MFSKIIPIKGEKKAKQNEKYERILVGNVCIYEKR